MTRSLFKTRTLLAAAAVASLAAGCHGAATRAPTTATRATFAPAAVTPVVAPAVEVTPVLAADPSAAQVVASPDPVSAPAPAPAAEPLCDADGRPLAGNVRKGKMNNDCEIAQAGPQL